MLFLFGIFPPSLKKSQADTPCNSDCLVDWQRIHHPDFQSNFEANTQPPSAVSCVLLPVQGFLVSAHAVYHPGIHSKRHCRHFECIRSECFAGNQLFPVRLAEILLCCYRVRWKTPGHSSGLDHKKAQKARLFPHITKKMAAAYPAVPFCFPGHACSGVQWFSVCTGSFCGRSDFQRISFPGKHCHYLPAWRHGAEHPGNA